MSLCGLKRGVSELRLLAARLRALRPLDGLSASTSCQLHPESPSVGLHARSWVHSHSLSSSASQQQGLHALSTMRHFGAAPQPVHEEEEEAEEALRLMSQQQPYYDAALAQRQASHSHASTSFSARSAAQQAADEATYAATMGMELAPEAAVQAWQQQDAQAGIQLSGASVPQDAQSLLDASLPPTEGEVYYGRGSLYERMRRHYQQLQQASPSYTARTSFDDFGARYIEQIRREEEARGRALQRDQAQKEQNRAAGGSGELKGRRDSFQATPSGAIGKKLVEVWRPLLAQAIAQEQQEVGVGPAAWFQ